MTKGANGYGIAIPGSIIDYEVETPGIVAGAGTISHDVKEVKAGNAPLTLQAWGTEVAGQKFKRTFDDSDLKCFNTNPKLPS